MSNSNSDDTGLTSIWTPEQRQAFESLSVLTGRDRRTVIKCFMPESPWVKLAHVSVVFLFVGFWSWKNASNFDWTEGSMISSAFASAVAYLFGFDYAKSLASLGGGGVKGLLRGGAVVVKGLLGR